MKVLILANNDVGLYKFRKELLEKLKELGHQVVLCLPKGNYIEKFENIGCEYIECSLLQRHGTNPIQELLLINFYRKLLQNIRPDIVFTYTIKPNVYGGIVCGLKKIPYVENITGLGNAVENPGIMQKITLFLYRLSVQKAQKVFFQNKHNLDYMVSKKIVQDRYGLLPGSGVNLDQFVYLDYSEEEKNEFLIIGRLMKDKGTDEILEAAKIIKNRYDNVSFVFIGSADEEGYREKVEYAVQSGIIEYRGVQNDVRPCIRECSAVLHASYHEGMSNVLLEAAACGRPIVATDVPGCIDTFIPDITGIAFKPKNVESLVEALEKFINIPIRKREKMGKEARKYIENNFSRNIVIQKYIDEMNFVNLKKKEVRE